MIEWDLRHLERVSEEKHRIAVAIIEGVAQKFSLAHKIYFPKLITFSLDHRLFKFASLRPSYFDFLSELEQFLISTGELLLKEDEYGKVTIALERLLSYSVSYFSHSERESIYFNILKLVHADQKLLYWRIETLKSIGKGLGLTEREIIGHHLNFSHNYSNVQSDIKCFTKEEKLISLLFCVKGFLVADGIISDSELKSLNQMKIRLRESFPKSELWTQYLNYSSLFNKSLEEVVGKDQVECLGVLLLKVICEDGNIKKEEILSFKQIFKGLEISSDTVNDWLKRRDEISLSEMIEDLTFLEGIFFLNRSLEAAFSDGEYQEEESQIIEAFIDEICQKEVTRVERLCGALLLLEQICLMPGLLSHLDGRLGEFITELSRGDITESHLRTMALFSNIRKDFISGQTLKSAAKEALDVELVSLKPRNGEVMLAVFSLIRELGERHFELSYHEKIKEYTFKIFEKLSVKKISGVAIYMLVKSLIHDGVIEECEEEYIRKLFSDKDLNWSEARPYKYWALFEEGQYHQFVETINYKSFQTYLV